MPTLYVTEPGSYLKVYEQQQFQVFHQCRLLYEVAVNQVNNLVLFGYSRQSDGAVNCALSHRIPVLFLCPKGTYFGRVETEERCPVKYLARQLKSAQNPDFTRVTAESIIRAKLHNFRVLLLRFFHCYPTKASQTALKAMALLIDDLPLADSVEALRGYAQTATTLYWQALASLFTEAFSFENLPQHPPTDPISSLLNLGYTLLNQNLYSLLQAVGLHSHFGNLHIHRDHHPALVADFREEFSTLLVDSLVVKLMIFQIFTPEDFTQSDEQGGVYLYPDAIKKFLTYWEKTLQSEATHLYAGKVNYQQCLEWQVREYVSYLLGDQEFYRPFVSKT
jgi:CRISPR-associated endonuclease Cas1